MNSISNAAISASSSGDNTVVAAVSGGIIRVLSYTIIATTAVSVTWKSGASTSLTGAMPLGATGGISTSPFGRDHCLFQTARGEALVLGLSGAVLVAGHLTYEVDV